MGYGRGLCMRGDGSWGDGAGVDGVSVQELEVFDVAQFTNVPEGHRREGERLPAQAPEARPSHGLPLVSIESEAETFRDIIKKGFHAAREVIETSDRALDRTRLVIKYQLIQFYHKQMFDANLINLQVSKSKEAQLDIAKEWARIREANPHLYRSRDPATIQLIDEKIRRLGESGDQSGSTLPYEGPHEP